MMVRETMTELRRRDPWAYATWRFLRVLIVGAILAVGWVAVNGVVDPPADAVEVAP